MTRLSRACLHRIGRRGASLLFLALLDAVFAYSLISLPLEAQQSPSWAFLLRLLPLNAWAAMWGGVGVLCAVQAFMLTDRLAFAAASLLKVLWGSVYLLGWAFGEIPRGWVFAAVWFGFAAFVQNIAGWREPPRGA